MARSRLFCVLCVILLSAVVIICFLIGIFSSRQCSRGQFTQAAVAADSLKCSQIGREMLQQGGSAVDGAIAALLCTSLINPQSMGLGGGAIFTIMDKSGKVKVISSRETVPKTCKTDLKQCPDSPQLTPGPQWIGVPGELRGYERAHKLYGKLPWATLFEPTIRLAREGFPMPPYLGKLLSHKLIRQLVQNTSLCEIFCSKNKTVLGIGDTLRFPKLADTMETIAQEGPDAFYTGKIAQDLVQDVHDAGGTLSSEDLHLYKVRESEAWEVPLGEHTLYIPPPPSGGALLSFILKVMQGYHLSPASGEGEQRILTLHRYIETLKFANGLKRAVRDPDFNSENLPRMMEMKQSRFTERIRSLIKDDSTQSDSYYNLTASTDHTGTTHVSVLAQDGSAVSATSTINQIFGSAVYSRRTGIILNNELVDFCGRAEVLKAGEQPPSSMAPAFIVSESKQKMLIIGGSGGTLITTAMAQAIMNHLWLGMNLTHAISEQVVFVDGKNTVHFECEVMGRTCPESSRMRSLGHRVAPFPYFFNVVNAVLKERGCITAVSDARKLSQAAGY
ncbi:glutathione hydrolase 5 proenzyme-like [Chanos chanos]|uniref:Glutathione hydrolase n=1 Tax=Chanos chanos TaxID=29144 RepID=A0A6J2UVM8_CHACN|nr:glutathione hydrolase 5 proenzyme-like [Chanos chanos]